jgi:PAS domain S-box-containing protein
MNQTTRILVVDDEPEILGVFTLILNAAGYDVLTASTGQHGLQLAREKRPDLVLLDVMLPDLNGMEVCKQIKSDPDLRDVFVVLISGGATNAAHKVEGLESGADDYMVKPLDSEELLARIRTIVRLRDTTAALRASEQHYRRLVEILPDAVGLIDLHGRLTSANRQAVEMLGYAGPEELLGKSVFDLTPPEEHERVKADITVTLETGVKRNTEYTMLRKNGSRFPVELSAVVSTDVDGQSRGIVIVARDITTRRQAEARIRELLHILDQAHDAIIIRDVEGHVQHFNKGAERLLGWTADEVKGRRTTDLFFADPSTFAEAQKMLLQTGEWSGEVQAVTKARKPIILHSRWTLVRGHHGQPPHVVSISTDITGRKQAEEALRQSQERYRSIFENATEGIFRTTLEGRILIANPALARMFGYPSLQEMMSSVTDVGQQIYVSLEKRAEMKRLLLEQGAIQGFEEENYRKDGSIIWVSLNAHTVYDASGAVQYFEGTIQDITGRKRAEAQVAMLAHAVESTAEMICITDIEDRFTFVNRSFLRAYGYTEVEILGKTPDLLFSPNNPPTMRSEILEQSRLDGWRGEVLDRRKDGTEFPVFLSTSKIMDLDGRVIGLIGVAQDITERRWAERWLQTQRDFGTYLSSSIGLNATAMQLLEIALQSEGIDCGGVYLVDPETGALDLVAHRGFSADFAKHASHFAADPGPARPAGTGRAISRPPDGPLTGIVQQLKRESLLAMEVLPVQHSGEVVAVLSVGSHVRGEIPAKSCQALEVIAAQAAGAIARIRAEQSLRANRQLLEKTLHSLRSAVFIVNGDTMVIEECNPATTQIFGYTRDEVIGRTTASLHANEAMAEQFASHLHSAVEDKGFLSDFEFKMRRKDGTVFPTEHSMMPIRNEVGRLVSWVSVVQDITERKRVGEELRQLPWRIIEAQETERLRVAREMHDGVNQVIASVKMRLRKVESQVGTLNPAAREILARCDNLLVQALEENRRIAHNLRPSDLDELGLAAACRNFCKEIQARTNLTVKCIIAPLGQRLPPAVELNLFRIVQEALTNVEKHAQARTIRLRLSFQGDSVVLRIQDDGRGFAPRRPRAGKGKWRGIGLTNMRERALSSGGTCEVLSTPKKGTTISVRIPCPPAG